MSKDNIEKSNDINDLVVNDENNDFDSSFNFKSLLDTLLRRKKLYFVSFILFLTSFIINLGYKRIYNPVYRGSFTLLIGWVSDYFNIFSTTLRPILQNTEIWVIPTHNPEGLSVVHGILRLEVAKAKYAPSPPPSPCSSPREASLSGELQQDPNLEVEQGTLQIVCASQVT